MTRRNLANPLPAVVAVIEVTLPAVTAGFSIAATVAPIVVNVTQVEVTATFSQAWNAAVAPVVVSVTIPAVTCTAVVPMSYMLLESGDKMLLESGDKMGLE